MDVEFDDEFKKRLISIIKKARSGRLDDYAEAAMLYHWVNNADDPIYAWVPDKYRRALPYAKINGGNR